jgi:hypothetical protein
VAGFFMATEENRDSWDIKTEKSPAEGRALR